MTAWLQTRSGLAFDYEDPKPEQIDIHDIAHALGHLCRFAGHASQHYSVAEHSVHCATFLRKFATEKTARWGLMHDAHEAYVVDVPSPLKRLLPDYKRVEKIAEFAVRFRFGLSGPMPIAVRMTDTEILLREAALLHGAAPPRPWGIPSPNWAFGEVLDYWARWSPECWPAAEASSRFLKQFRELFPEVTP